MSLLQQISFHRCRFSALHPFIQREDLFRGKLLLLDQREFFRTESDMKIRKMEENRFANFSTSVED